MPAPVEVEGVATVWQGLLLQQQFLLLMSRPMQPQERRYISNRKRLLLRLKCLLENGI